MSRIGFIGCGNIANHHADALIHLGHEISAVCSKTGSNRQKDFSKKYSIAHQYQNWRELIDSKDYDVLWVIPTPETIDEIFHEIIHIDVPIFVEKPIALSSKNLSRLIELSKTRKNKIQVGYNRRYYSHINQLKNTLEDKRLTAVNVEIPEAIEENPRYQWFSNSSHIIDLLFNLLGPLSIHSKLINLDCKSFQVILKDSNDIAINLSCNWGAAQNFSIKFQIENETHILNPIEKYSIFEGMEEGFDNELKIKTYSPRLTFESSLKPTNFKPGFLEQTIDFFENNNTEDLDLLYKQALLMEEIISSS